MKLILALAILFFVCAFAVETKKEVKPAAPVEAKTEAKTDAKVAAKKVAPAKKAPVKRAVAKKNIGKKSADKKKKEDDDDDNYGNNNYGNSAGQNNGNYAGQTYAPEISEVEQTYAPQAQSLPKFITHCTFTDKYCQKVTACFRSQVNMCATSLDNDSYQISIVPGTSGYDNEVVTAPTVSINLYYDGQCASTASVTPAAFDVCAPSPTITNDNAYVIIYNPWDYDK